MLRKLLLLLLLLLALLARARGQAISPLPPLGPGDLYQGMTRAIPDARVVAPYGLEVAFDKTVHLIFPAAIRYVDLGSPCLMAGKAEGGAENVLRVKAAVEGFERETNLGVICDDGSFYSFNVRYAIEPARLNVEMADFLHTANGNLPTNRQDLYFHELGSAAPTLVRMIMESLWRKDERRIKHIGVEEFGVVWSLRGIYSQGGCSTSTPRSRTARGWTSPWTSSPSGWWTARCSGARPSRSGPCRPRGPTRCRRSCPRARRPAASTAWGSSRCRPTSGWR